MLRTSGNLLIESLITTLFIKGTQTLLGITWMTFITELFDSRIRSFTFSVQGIIGKIFILFAPQYVQYFKYIHLHVIVGCCMPFLLTIPILFGLPETRFNDADLGEIDRKSVLTEEK